MGLSLARHPPSGSANQRNGSVSSTRLKTDSTSCAALGAVSTYCVRPPSHRQSVYHTRLALTALPRPMETRQSPQGRSSARLKCAPHIYLRSWAQQPMKLRKLTPTLIERCC